jgi:hypothetical protein
MAEAGTSQRGCGLIQGSSLSYLGGMTRPRIVVHSLAHARAALAAAEEAGVRVTLESPAAAALYLGIGWWRELLRALATGQGAHRYDSILDCGTAPGAALAAVRDGIPAVRVAVDNDMLERLSAIAAPLGGTVHGGGGNGDCLDLLDAADARQACAEFLMPTSHWRSSS